MTNFEEIKSAAEHMFGADNVDMQTKPDKSDLIIHWDEIEVSNENDEKHTIYDMYVKVTFEDTGKLLWFQLTRTSLTREEMDCGYIFSHVNKVYGSFIHYLNPCLGTGPIRNTISSLSKEYDADLFGLFLLELDRYVRTESLKGMPYIRFGVMGNGETYCNPYTVYNISPNNRDIPRYVRELYEYIRTSGEMKPKRTAIGSVSFGNMVDVACRVSRLTAEYIRRKKDFYDGMIGIYLIRARMSEGNIYTSTCSGHCINGNILCDVYFKGRRVPFRVIEDNVDSHEYMYVVHSSILGDIMSLLYRDYYLGINGMSE